MNTKISTHYVLTLSGIHMPKIIYGTAWKKEKTTDLVVEAILQGFRGIDTACQPKHYRENLVGEALKILARDHKIPRESLFIQTKFTSLDGQDLNDIPYDKNASLSDQVHQSLQKSLSNLNTEYLDSLVLHSPMRTYEDTMTVWKIFESFVKEGKVYQIGISNIYSLKLLEKIWDNASIKPAVIQNRFYKQSDYDVDIRNFCDKNGIIYQSFWTLTANPYVINSSIVKSLAQKMNVTCEQVFFKYIMNLGIVPLTGTTSKIHMKQDLEVLDMPDLNEKEIEDISTLLC